MGKGCYLTSPILGAFSSKRPSHGVHLGKQTHSMYDSSRTGLTGSVELSQTNV